MREESKLRAYRAAAHIPRWIWVPLGQAVAWCVAVAKPKGTRRWMRNVELATGIAPSFTMTRRAMWSWVRNNVASLQLGERSPNQIRATVEIDAARFRHLRNLASERGLVLALPHMGSWDLAGAYACLGGLPVTSIAEKLPAGQFEYFRALRNRLGFTIVAYDEPDVVGRMCDEILAGRTVCLVADRDFSGHGVAVRWDDGRGGRSLTLPAGPALVARRTGAALVPVICHFTARGMTIDIGDEINTTDLDDAMQAVCDAFAAGVRAHPTSWLMLQRFFRKDRR